MSLREIFRAEGLPVLQNRLYSNVIEAMNSPTGDIVLVQEESTGLIFNSAFHPDEVQYTEEYQNEQACSEIFRCHLETVTAIIARYFGGRSLIEIGCGKGYLIENLLSRGFNITGIDSAYEGDNPRIIKAHYHRGMNISGEGIILRHVLEHVPDPISFIADIAQANGGRGRIYIEVPCFDWICRHRCWFDIFYEHVNYFRLEDFHRVFASVMESGHIFGGQYIYVVADLASLRQPRADKTSSLHFPTDFLDGIGRFLSIARASRCNTIWGGASKGVIFAVYMMRAGVRFDYVIDINPTKQGKYLPSSGLHVKAPVEVMKLLRPNDSVFVMNSNYLPEIVTQSENRYCYYTVDNG